MIRFVCVSFSLSLNLVPSIKINESKRFNVQFIICEWVKCECVCVHAICAIQSHGSNTIHSLIHSVYLTGIEKFRFFFSIHSSHLHFIPFYLFFCKNPETKWKKLLSRTESRESRVCLVVYRPNKLIISKCLLNKRKKKKIFESKCFALEKLF